MSFRLQRGRQLGVVFQECSQQSGDEAFFPEGESAGSSVPHTVPRGWKGRSASPSRVGAGRLRVEAALLISQELCLGFSPLHSPASLLTTGFLTLLVAHSGHQPRTCMALRLQCPSRLSLTLGSEFQCLRETGRLPPACAWTPPPHLPCDSPSIPSPVTGGGGWILLYRSFPGVAARSGTIKHVCVALRSPLTCQAVFEV